MSLSSTLRASCSGSNAVFSQRRKPPASRSRGERRASSVVRRLDLHPDWWQPNASDSCHAVDSSAYSSADVAVRGIANEPLSLSSTCFKEQPELYRTWALLLRHTSDRQQVTATKLGKAIVSLLADAGSDDLHCFSLVITLPRLVVTIANGDKNVVEQVLQTCIAVSAQELLLQETSSPVISALMQLATAAERLLHTFDVRTDALLCVSDAVLRAEASLRLVSRRRFDDVAQVWLRHIAKALSCEELNFLAKLSDELSPAVNEYIGIHREQRLSTITSSNDFVEAYEDAIDSLLFDNESALKMQVQHEFNDECDDAVLSTFLDSLVPTEQSERDGPCNTTTDWLYAAETLDA